MGNSQPELLFVYGTLRSGHGGPQAARLASEASLLGPGEAGGRLLRVGSYPGLVPGEGRVRGEIYRLYDPAGTLRWLDRYEGPAFIRELKPVRAGNRERQAWVYRYAGPASGLPEIAGGDFLHPE